MRVYKRELLGKSSSVVEYEVGDERDPRDPRTLYQWYTHGAPFVTSARAHLIHRPRSWCRFSISGSGGSGPFAWKHDIVSMWCGQSPTSTQQQLFALEERSIVCAVCEGAAIAQGYKSAEEIVGRHVHVGGVQSIAYCCDVTGKTRREEL